MHFDDATFVAFEDIVTATALFSDDAQKALAAASYGLEMSSLSGAPTTLFDPPQFAPFPGQMWTETQREGHSMSTRPADLDAPGSSTRADILLRGTVTLNAAFPRAEIGVASIASPNLSNIDGDIPNPVPTDAAALDAARRTVVLDRLKAAANDADAVSDASLDAWIASTGSATLTEFLDRAGAASVPLAQFVLSFTPLPGTSVAAPVAFPVMAAVMIRDPGDAGFKLTDFMQASKAVLNRMDNEGAEPKPGGDALPLGRSVVAWLVPQSWFDDADWPGGGAGNAAAQRNDRITRATEWLVKHRIALVPISG